MRPEQIIEVLDGEELTIWVPRGGEDHHGYLISDCGGWLDGSYADIEAARLGFRLSRSEDGWSRLARLRDQVHGVEERRITVEDFQGDFEVTP